MQSTIPGWYGKIPSLGDFAFRRLPSQFISQWDNWLQQCIRTSQLSLGEDWLATYLTTPIWRFLLLPGVIDTHTWTGLIMPSVDKVGRHFPLTVATPTESFFPLTNDMFSTNQWHTFIESSMLATLDTNSSVAQFEASLANFPTPSFLNNDDTLPGGHSLINWLKHPSDLHSVNLSTLEALQNFFGSASQEFLTSQIQSMSFWWTCMESTGDTRLCWFKGLPPEEQFTHFLKKNVNEEAIATGLKEDN